MVYKRLVSKIYKDFSKSDSKTTNDLIRPNELNWMKRHLTQEAIQMADKPVKKYLPSLATREMKIKTTKRFHYTHVCMARIKNKDNAKCQ